MKTVNDVLIATGLLGSVGLSIYAAHPWGDNYAYQDLSGYLTLLLFDLWIALPFVILFLLNRYYRASAVHLKLLLFACLSGSLYPVWVYVQAIVFSNSSTSALIFIYLPAYQLCFLAVIAIVCLVMSKARSRC